MSDVFEPYSPALGISGSSYQLQLGKVNTYWAIRLVKGSDVLASKVYNDIPNPEEMPLINSLTGWIISVLAVPNLNTYQIQKTVGFIRQKAMETFEEQKRIKAGAGKSERTEFKLEKPPEEAILKRPQATGWVKEEVATIDVKSAEIQNIAEHSPALAASNQSVMSGITNASLGTRQLNPIPIGEGFVPKKSSVQEGKIVAASAVGASGKRVESVMSSTSILQ